MRILRSHSTGATGYLDLGMRREGALLTTPRGGRQAAPLQRAEDEDEFENEDDLVRLRRARNNPGCGSPPPLSLIPYGPAQLRA
jgi:hypothetical protein